MAFLWPKLFLGFQFEENNPDEQQISIKQLS